VVAYKAHVQTLSQMRRTRFGGLQTVVNTSSSGIHRRLPTVEYLGRGSLGEAKRSEVHRDVGQRGLQGTLHLQTHGATASASAGRLGHRHALTGDLAGVSISPITHTSLPVILHGHTIIAEGSMNHRRVNKAPPLVICTKTSGATPPNIHRNKHPGHSLSLSRNPPPKTKLFSSTAGNEAKQVSQTKPTCWMTLPCILSPSTTNSAAPSPASATPVTSARDTEEPIPSVKYRVPDLAWSDLTNWITSAVLPTWGEVGGGMMMMMMMVRRVWGEGCGVGMGGKMVNDQGMLRIGMVVPEQ
jgi:hypothetical protein